MTTHTCSITVTEQDGKLSIAGSVPDESIDSLPAVLILRAMEAMDNVMSELQASGDAVKTSETISTVQ